jgi:hypothetical protein
MTLSICHIIIIIIILQSFDWLATFHMELLQATLVIAAQLPAAVLLATCFKYRSQGLPTALFLDIAPSSTFTTNSLCLIVCPIHECHIKESKFFL